MTLAYDEKYNLEEDNYSDDDLYNITSWGADLTFRELITMYEENELLKPELQRKYVWDKKEASRFIESILLGLPVPSIFLALTKDEDRLIIDGYQRIMTIYDYVRGVYSKDNKVFKLANSDLINERWRGKAFSELSQTDQKKIKNTTIHAIIFKQISPKENDTSYYQIFERINTSGQSLRPQEIRNCVYQGPFNNLLFKLNKHEKWRLLYGKDEEDKRMQDLEFILRFFALASPDIRLEDSGQISLKKQLNTFMGSKINNNQDTLSKFSNDFHQTMNFIYNNFGVEAFHNINENNENELVSRFHPTVFDAISIATCYVLNKIDEKKIDLTNISKKRRELLKDPNFKDFTRIRTTKFTCINGRIRLAAEKLYGIKYE